MPNSDRETLGSFRALSGPAGKRAKPGLGKKEEAALLGSKTPCLEGLRGFPFFPPRTRSNNEGSL